MSSSLGWIVAAAADLTIARELADGFGLEMLDPAALADAEGVAATVNGAQNVGIVLSHAAAQDSRFVAVVRLLVQRLPGAQLIFVESDASMFFAPLPAWPTMALNDALSRARGAAARRPPAEAAPTAAPEPEPAPVAAPLPEPEPPQAGAPEEVAAVEAPPEESADDDERSPALSAFDEASDDSNRAEVQDAVRENGFDVIAETCIARATEAGDEWTVAFAFANVALARLYTKGFDADSVTPGALIDEISALLGLPPSIDDPDAEEVAAHIARDPSAAVAALANNARVNDAIDSNAPTSEHEVGREDMKFSRGGEPEEPAPVLREDAPQVEPPASFAPPPEMPPMPSPQAAAPAPMQAARKVERDALHDQVKQRTREPNSESFGRAVDMHSTTVGSLGGANARLGETAPADATAFAPKKLRRGTPELVRIAIHQPKDLKAVIKAAKQADKRTEPAPQSMSIGDVALGAHVGVSLEVRGANCDGAVQRRVWLGEPLDFNFVVDADGDAKQAVILARVFVDDAQIGMVAFTRGITGPKQKPESSGEAGRLKRFKRVFLSYSSQDREIVAKIATAYEMAGVEHFFDRTSLKSGEEWSPRLSKEIDRSDLFHLCWSKAASKSQWVEKEAEHALIRRARSNGKTPAITVQMLDGPPWAPHPRHLDSINFDDFVRAAIVGYARGDGE